MNNITNIANNQIFQKNITLILSKLSGTNIAKIIVTAVAAGTV